MTGWPDHDQFCPECGVWASDAHECDEDAKAKYQEAKKEKPR